MTANDLMKANVKALLAVRHRSPEDLAKWLHNSVSWIDKIYREPRRTFPITYYDRIAKFFGVEVYQLLQPGIADRAERRSGQERRKQMDRRVSQAVISEKALDVDLIHVVRALSLEGRRQAIGVLMDLLNDELRSLRAKPAALAAPGHTDEMPPAARARAPRPK